MAQMMYSHNAIQPPQKPETFMLSSEAQQSLPQDAQVALQQVDNRKLTDAPQLLKHTLLTTAAYQSNIFSFPLPLTGRQNNIFEDFFYPQANMYHVYYGMYSLAIDMMMRLVDIRQEQPLPHFRHRYCAMPLLSISSIRPTGQELQEV